MSETIDHRVEIADAVATVTFDRPQAYNAFTADLIQSLLVSLKSLERDKAVRAIGRELNRRYSGRTVQDVVDMETEPSDPLDALHTRLAATPSPYGTGDASARTVASEADRIVIFGSFLTVAAALAVARVRT